MSGDAFSSGPNHQVIPGNIAESDGEGRSDAHGIHIIFVTQDDHGRCGICSTFPGSFCLVMRRFLGSKTSRCCGQCLRYGDTKHKVLDVQEGGLSVPSSSLLGSWEDWEMGP